MDIVAAGPQGFLDSPKINIAFTLGSTGSRISVPSRFDTSFDTNAAQNQPNRVSSIWVRYLTPSFAGPLRSRSFMIVIGQAGANLLNPTPGNCERFYTKGQKRANWLKSSHMPGYSSLTY